MTVPDGFEVKCFAAEPDIVNPIGIDFDHKGRVWVLECLEYPRKAPAGAKTRDRITILEDTDGDGIADKVTRFAEGLNLATGLAVGHGGVFVGQAPELLFLQDTDGDDRADQRMVLLDGWGHQDTHETLNSLLWGPDGWLYGCHGVFTHSRVGKPGTPDKERVPLNAGIWRYHPLTKKFEVFAEGTSNPWGFDFDENGSGFLTACVIPHLFHMVPGGLYIRQAGQNFNPHAYGQIREICDHVHYFGPSPHGGNKDPRSLDKGGGHAHAGCLIYQGGAYPEEWHGRVFMNNIHGGRINTDVLKRNGSTYVGSHGPDFLIANDPSFRAIQLRTGPDGSVYLIDWYDPQVCHDNRAALWDRAHGRVYKVVHKGTKQPKVGDLTKRSSEELVERLKDRNSWWWRKALLVLQERGDRSVAPKLKAMVAKSDDYRHSLRALWALYNVGAFGEDFGRETLGHANPWLRAWAVRLLGQRDAAPAVGTWRQLLELAKADPSPDVRLQLALSCQRWRHHTDPTDLLQELMQRGQEAKDPVIPLMIWVAFEPGVVGNHQANLHWLVNHAAKYPTIRDAILPRTLRRLASTDEAKHLNAVLAALDQVPTMPVLTAGLDGLLEALRGRRLEPPPAWGPFREHMRKLAFPPPDLRRQLRRLGIHFGDEAAVREAQQLALQGANVPLEQRIEAVQGLALARMPTSVEPLIQLAVGDAPEALKREALRALAGFDQDEVPAKLLAEWKKYPSDLRTEVIGLLSGRRSWAKALLDALKKGTPGKQELTENDVRRILALKDAELAKKVEAVWGKIRERTPEKLEQQLAKFRKQLAEVPGDRKAGQAVFEKSCMVCHKLGGKGHEVGPDLTGANRRDPEYLLVNVLDPNRVVGKDYYSATVVDKSGRVHTGLLTEDTPQRITLKGENAKLTTLPRTEILEMKVEEKSLMPEGLPEAMTEQQFRDLVAYLMEEPLLTRGLIAGPFKMAIDSKGPIEEAADPLKTEGVKWKPFQLGPAGIIDMEKLGVLAPPTDSTAYVYVEVVAPQACKVELEVAADEDVKLWVNGKEVHRRTRSLEPRRVAVELKEGTNRLLFKVHNIYGPSWLRARLSDPERRLELGQPKAQAP
jgi:putative membrane-bound dehydrogenase-like protein